MEISNNKIIISKELQNALLKVLEEIEGYNHKVFETDEFKVENVKEVVKEAYIAESETKYLILCAKNYNIYAQNALLKILEEPPRNIIIIMISPSKAIFLPTIRSRMSIRYIKTSKDEIELPFKLDKLSLKEIFEFLKKNRYTKKGELKEIIQQILKNALLKDKITLSEKEISQFSKAMELADLNTRAQIILANLFLTIINREKR